MNYKNIKIICLIFSFLFFISSFAIADGSAIEFRNDFRQSPGAPEAEYLDIGDVAFRTELLLEGIFNKRGDWWYTSPNKLNNNFRYDSSNKSLQDQDWKDRWGQTLFLDVAFRPTEWFSAQFGLEFLGDYASRYWTTVNHAHRMYDNSQIIPQFSWNTAKVEIHNDWAKLQYNRGQAHYNWQNDGDMFNIYQKQTDPYNDLRVTGRAVPEWFQLNLEGSFGDLEVQYGEAITDYKRGIYVKYNNIFNSNFNFFYADHVIPYGEDDERMRTAEVSTDFKIKEATLQLGAKFRPFRIDRTYQYEDGKTQVGYDADKDGVVDSYSEIANVKEGTTNYGDAFGGAVKLSVPNALWMDRIDVKYTYEGLVAGNKNQINATVQKKINTEITGAFDAMYRKPLQDALSVTASSYGPDLVKARGETSPFWVWWRNEPTGFDNRHTAEFKLTFTYDPTPETWFYKYEENTVQDWNLNPDEDSLVTFATQVKLTRHFGRTDKQVYRDENGDIVWENFSGNPVYGANSTNGYLASWLFLTRMFLGDAELVYDFEVGEDVPTLSAAYTSQEEFLKKATGYFKTNLKLKLQAYQFKIGYGKDVFGYEDWQRQFGATFDEVYYAQVSRQFCPRLTAGVDYVGVRKTDPVIISKIDGDSSSRSEIGSYDEVRLFVRIIFDALFKFKKKDRVEKDEIVPVAELSVDQDVFMPSKGQKAILYPVATDDHGIATWTIKILNKDSTIVNSFNGKGEVPQSVQWNGRDFENRYLPDATYTAQLIATDTFGNVAKSNICDIKLITPDIKVVETDRGLKMSFAAKVLFDFDKSNIKRSAQKPLKEAVRILNTYTDRNISIEGHTDSYGSGVYNKKLSERRAKAVADYLIKEGINKDRIVILGLGEDVPVASNKTASGREQNRRVEILILKEDNTKTQNVEYDLQK